MNNKVYPALLILSAASLSIGGYSLYAGKLVPVMLTYLTIFAVAFILVLSILMIFYENRNLRIIGMILAVISIITSSNSSHISALASFGTSTYLSVADVTMITGFFLFPIIYIILFTMNSLRKGDMN